MKKIFISYRRDEAEYAAGALGRTLRTRFGEDQVFRDKENIAGGESWKKRVLAEIDRDSALLVLVSRDWAALRDAQGRRRLDNESDPMRMEIVDGLRDGAAVIPILLENAEMPHEAELPEDVKALAERNALALRDGDWRHDVERICETLERAGFHPVTTTSTTSYTDARKRGPTTKARGAPIKLIVGCALLGLTFIGFNEDPDPNTFLGMAVFSAVATILAGMSYRDYQRGRTRRGWPSIALICAGLVLTFAYLGLVSSNAEDEPYVDPFGNTGPLIPANFTGSWTNADGLAFNFVQIGSSLTLFSIFDGSILGQGQVFGNHVELTVTLSNFQPGNISLDLLPDGRTLSGTMSGGFGSRPFWYTRN